MIAGSTQATGAGFSLRFTASLDQVGVELFENGKLLVRKRIWCDILGTGTN